MPEDLNLIAIRAAVERAAPEKLFWGVFPGNGGFYLAPAGLTTIDLKNRKITSDAGQENVQIPREIIERSQALILVVDSLVFVEILPGVGKFLTAGAFI